MKLSYIGATVLTCLFLTACGGAPASNEIRVDNDGNGRFSGTAGTAVTDQDIKNSVKNIVCASDQTVTAFSRRAIADSTIFNGQCG